MACAGLLVAAVWSTDARTRDVAPPSRILIAPRAGVVVGSLLEARSSSAGRSRPRVTWLRCDWTGSTCVPVRTGRTYRLTVADVGRTFRAREGAPASAPTSARTAVVLPADGVPVVAAAGDIACDPTSPGFKSGAGTRLTCKQGTVSELVLARHPTAVLTLGDTQYECGDASAFAGSFDPSWGRLRSIIRPTIGNHEYGKACRRNDPSPYFAYFGSAAAGPRGWYSYSLGAWHVIALNSECSYGEGADSVGGCGSGSPEEAWLRNDLRSHPARCTLVYWHEPRFSSGEHGDALQMSTIWNDLVAAHVDLVLSGHNHDYERFDPAGSTPLAQTSPVPDAGGIREFVVGTGGRNLYPFAVPPLAGEVLRSAEAFGALFLRLAPGSYSWQFVPAPDDGSLLDEGSGACH